MSRKRSRTPEAPDDAWQEYQSSVWHRDFGTTPSTKLACFDLDGTIVVPKSGKKGYVADPEDWRLFAPKVKANLRALVDEGMKIVIISNQKGVNNGKPPLSDLTAKIEKIQKNLEVPLQVFFDTGDGIYRKPRIGMWTLAVRDHNGGLEVDPQSSFYVGDAAGREASLGKSRDFSDGDVKFALNVGIPFRTPEQHFLGAKSSVNLNFDFDPRRFRKHRQTHGELKPKGHQEVILLVGAPGSGKSTIARKYFSRRDDKGYIIINQDTLKDKKKCMTLFEETLDKKRSVIIDRQNHTLEQRKPFIDLAKARGIQIRAVHLKVQKAFCFHLNMYRSIDASSPEHRDKVPTPVIHGYFKNLAAPTVKEGINEIVEVTEENLEPGPFETKSSEELFFLFMN